MQRHPAFNLFLHDDAELEAIIGSPIIARRPLNEWPLSCVQLIETAAGRFIYKVQAPPTVEPAFYQHARSPAIAKARILEASQGPPALLLEEVCAPRLCDFDHLLASRGIAIVEEVIAAISQIQGELPALADIRTRGGWMDTVSTMQTNLQALAASGQTPVITQQVIAEVSRACRSTAVHAALDTPQGYVHFNLTVNNVLLADDGLRVLDWQRPLYGPVALDRASLLESLGLDPRPHVLPGVLQLHSLLLINWYAASARFWFPQAAAYLTADIARLAARLLPDPPHWVPFVPQIIQFEPGAADREPPVFRAL